ncbi:hypothetical protein MMC07_003734 [Pseudocyphellaria aurata]|nr:hypothetical protein [Pseudocyphellaria aurata]
MSGIPIHTQSPISPAKDGSTTSTPSSYPSARPGAAPTPTRTQATGSRHDPPPPQPGAIPIPSQSTMTAKPNLPPPPKVGEVVKPPEYYTAAQATPTKPTHPQPYPQQMTLPSPVASHGQPPASTTSPAYMPSFASTASIPSSQHVRPTPSGSFPLKGSGKDDASLEHPPGYVQNPYASDMTPSQRFATEQASQPERSPALGYSEKRRTSNAGFEDNEGLWGMAKKWAKEASDTVGTYVNDVNEKASKGFDNPK